MFVSRKPVSSKYFCSTGSEPTAFVASCSEVLWYSLYRLMSRMNPESNGSNCRHSCSSSIGITVRHRQHHIVFITNLTIWHFCVLCRHNNSVEMNRALTDIYDHTILEKDGEKPVRVMSSCEKYIRSRFFRGCRIRFLSPPTFVSFSFFVVNSPVPPFVFVRGNFSSPYAIPCFHSRHQILFPTRCRGRNRHRDRHIISQPTTRILNSYMSPLPIFANKHIPRIDPQHFSTPESSGNSMNSGGTASTSHMPLALIKNW